MWINKLMKKRREMVIHSFHNTRSDNSVELIEHKKKNESFNNLAAAKLWELYIS